MLPYQILSSTIHEKILKMAFKNKKIQIQRQMEDSNWLMNHIMYQLFKIILFNQ